MDGVFNATLRPSALSDVDELKRRVEGLVRANADLRGEIKILKAKIAGQRAVIRKLNGELK